MQTTPNPVVAGTRIGHVHLKVADLDRALGFYCGVLGFEIMQRYGDQAAFISAGGYHHHIGLNTWESKGGSPPPPGTTGLYHTAILYPTRPALADALHRVLSAGIALDGAVLNMDKDTNAKVYGSSDAKEILNGNMAMNATVRPFMDALDKVVPKKRISQK